MIKNVTLVCFVRRGGMVHYTAELANALADKANVELIIPDCVDTSYFDSRITLHLLPAGLSGRDTILKLINPIFMLNLWRLLRNAKGDVVHVPTTHPWNIFVPLFARKPVLFTVHDPIHHSGESWHIEFVDTFMKRRSKAFIVHEDKAVEYLKPQVPNNRLIAVAPMGDFSLFNKKSNHAQEKAFLFFGRIEEYKGIGTLLEAWPEVAKALPDWKLIIAGQGDLSQYANQLESKTIEVHNRFVGDEEVGGFFSRSSIVVLPYHDATQSGVLMIAAAFSRPVIASNVGAIPTVVKDKNNGILIPPKDSNALAQAMIDLAKEEALAKKLGKALAITIKQDNSWHESAQIHLVAYEKLT